MQLIQCRSVLVLALFSFSTAAAAQTTTRVSLSSAGTQGNQGSSQRCVLSSDARFVAFASEATNLFPGDINNGGDTFVRDRVNLTTELVTLDSNGNPSPVGYQSAGEVLSISASSDGRLIAFVSAAPMVPGDTNNMLDVFLRDRTLGTTERVSLGQNGAQSLDDSAFPSMSADGRFVAFRGGCSLLPGCSSTAPQIYVRDRVLGLTMRGSVSTSGLSGSDTCEAPAMSGDGRFVAFASRAGDLVLGDTNGFVDVFVRDLQLGVNERVSVDSA